MTVMALPSLALPCGFDRYRRPVGLQGRTQVVRIRAREISTAPVPEASREFLLARH